MPITYLDEQPKSKITYLDEEPTTGFFGKIPLSAYQSGERNWMGNVAERPGTAIRSFLQGKGYAQGAINPSNVPTFQNLALKRFSPRTSSVPLNFIGGLPASVAGLTADIATNPADVLALILGKTPTGGGIDLGTRVGATKAGQAVSRFGKLPIGETAPGRVLTEGVPKTFKAVREAPGKIARTVAETPVEEAKFLKETIRKEGAGGLFGGALEKSPYIKDVLAPEAYDIYRTNLEAFTPSIQEAAVKEFKVPQSAIDVIKSKGYKYAEDLRTTLNDSTDFAYQRIKEGLDIKRAEADNAYAKAMFDYKAPTINAEPFYQSLREDLRSKGWIDLQDNPTTRYKNGLGVVDRLNDQLTNVFMDVKSSGKLIGKEDFSRFRDNLSGIGWENPSVQRAKDALYHSAEKSGVRGIKAARDLEHNIFEREKAFSKSALIKEKGLDRYQSLTEQQLRDLKALEDYTGVKFLDDLSTLTASREMDKLARLDKFKIGDMLDKAVNPKEFNSVKEQLTPYLGKDTDRILSQVRKYRAVQAVSPKGIYPSIAGTRRGIARYGLRGYYENIYPKMQSIGKFGKVPNPSLLEGGRVPSSSIAEGLSIFPQSIEKVSSKPILGSGKGWVGDRGTMPGEPIATYKNSGAIIELVDDSGNVLYQSVDNSGNVLGVFPELQSAKLKVEQTIDQLLSTKVKKFGKVGGP